ncbi:hypothetical protein PR048_031637 [Dryococelus australis]|uniref:THAP-type domain-containing protein n=1 Tax=Dryococelus australis TaxID=614101 RepID=A0ABQ9G5U4_9NEOP|nr:hypothetical protein PR048_031637 [Dryococelus australis]
MVQEILFGERSTYTTEVPSGSTPVENPSTSNACPMPQSSATRAEGPTLAKSPTGQTHRPAHLNSVPHPKPKPCRVVLSKPVFIPSWQPTRPVLYSVYYSRTMSKSNNNCAIADCSNYGRKTSDIINVWVSRCKHADIVNVNNACVCSVHFVPDDYERNLSNELLGLPIRKKLLPNVIPSQQLLNWHAQETVAKGNTLNFQLKVMFRRIADGKTVHVLDTLSIETTMQMMSKQNSASELPHNLKKKKKRIGFLKTSLRKHEAALIKAKTVRHVNPETTVATSRIIREATGREVEKILAKCFTRAQILSLLCGNKLDGTLKRQQAYIYLGKHDTPLPCRSTLQKWTDDFKSRPGILNEILCLLSAKSATFSEMGKVAVLTFDDMNIDDRICYDSSDDVIMGPHKNVQVVMIRGLFVVWKQPIFYGFDVTMTSELLKNIIIQVEARGITTVVAVTCDMGGKNLKVWKELCVNTDKPYFAYPVCGDRKIWVFYDIPHLLKLFRNHFIDDSITLPHGTHPKRDLPITHHVSETPLNVTGRARQNVSLAAQLFSHRTAKALNYLLGKKQSYRLMKNRLCEMAINSTINTLKRFWEVCPVLHFGKRNSLLPFQKGFIISMKLRMGLYEDLKKMNVIVIYILTSCLNQDFLENFFFRFRHFGNPSDSTDRKCKRYPVVKMCVSAGRKKMMVLLHNAVLTEKTNLQSLFQVNCVLRLQRKSQDFRRQQMKKNK